MSDFWTYEFLRHALLSALLLGPTCGFLGVFITLRGMAFFSDAIAHAALTGVALGVVVQELVSPAIPLMGVVLLFSLALAAAMSHFFEKTTLRPDTIIAFSFTGSVALGVLVLSKMGKYRLLDGLLFGDIYATTTVDLWAQLGLAVFVALFFGWNLKTYVLCLVQADLARVEGVKLERLHRLFALLIAAIVTVCIKMLGALLLSGLIVIPPAAAKLVARNFRQMIGLSVGFGLLAAAGGTFLSNAFNLPAGPTIVLANLALLLGCYGVARLRVS